jgi:serine phosphatase RsbU (regulator of sigma subunit)
MLLSNAHLALEEQKQIIYSTFENWKGYNYQVDDVTMIGLKI